MPQYPSIRSGGLFLAIMGLAMVMATFLGSGQGANLTMFFGGTTLAILSFPALRSKLSYGKVSKKQTVALIAAIVFGALLLTTICPRFEMSGERVYWLVTLLLVGVHFLPMTWTFGPSMALLGTLCIVNAGFGLLFPKIPFMFSGVADGTLKLAIGITMLLHRPLAGS